MRRVLIVGAGQCGLQLSLSLLAEGYDVTVMSARTPEEIRGGWPTSTQGMFYKALQTERDYGLNLWEDRVPQFAGLHVALSAPPGQKALDILARLDNHGESTDQRLKMAGWLELIEQRGGTVIYQGVTTADLDGLATLGRFDLTIVAAGRGELGALFDRNPSRSPYTTPQRGLAVAYVHGLTPDPMFPEPNVGFNAIPGGFGELFVIPSLTLSGPCDILFWEVVPDGPLDVWKERLDPVEHLTRTLELIREYLPWVYERCANVELTDARATLSGRFTPTVRHPVGELPSGGIVLGAADVVVANDPITGQGSNNAAKCAHAYLQSILARGDAPFDRPWMEETFESWWQESAMHSTMWTNSFLQPLPEHVQQLLGAASQDERIARRLANGFSDPTDFQHWFATPEAAQAYLGSLSA